ncbi:MAG: gliding motility-associated C-terminal domain-containing protein [Ferruginibacter sp.]|nr:gliding motility-associated C-terminal domain-containing protein [Ferruginibacter sp.]
MALNIAAQLCSGSFGDPLVKMTFGSGANPGAPLAAATTNYQYVSNDCPNDGFYTVRNATNSCFGNNWFTLNADHTGGGNGYFMLVNASILPSAFYIDTVRGLCGNSTYEFAAWIMNVSILQPSGCGGNPIQPNITFSIEKLDGTVLQTSNTNNIATTTNAIWNQFGLVFTTPAGVSDIVLRMTNNASGGCGNDLALDDITFRPCGPQLTPSITGTTSLNTTVCEGVAQNVQLNCLVSAGFNNATYQWQESFNGSVFTDIIGENSITMVKNFLSTAPIGIYKYRLSVAEAGNLATPQCRISSAPITITVNKKPTVFANSNSPICAKSSIVLTGSGAVTYQWLGPNGFNSSLNPININNAKLIDAGTYFVTGKDAFGCDNTANTMVIINAAPTATTLFTDTTICLGNSILLSASGGGAYAWLPSNTLTDATIANPKATPTDSTNYMVVVTNAQNCNDTAFTKVRVVNKPIVNAGVDKIIVANKNVQLNGSITGLIDNFIWTPNENITNVNILNPTVNPSFEKKYTLTATAKNGCGIAFDEVNVKIYEGIFIPNIFTPNGDSKNDTWNIPALEAYPLHELIVYNRYGQIVFERRQSFKPWDGKYNGLPQPNGSYVYAIDLKNGDPILKGTLIIVR